MAQLAYGLFDAESERGFAKMSPELRRAVASLERSGMLTADEQGAQDLARHFNRLRDPSQPVLNFQLVTAARNDQDELYPFVEDLGTGLSEAEIGDRPVVNVMIQQVPGHFQALASRDPSRNDPNPFDS